MNHVRIPPAGRNVARSVRRSCSLHSARVVLSLAVAVALSATALQARAGQVFSDSYTLQTQNQSMWGGASDSWSNSTGFQGVKWGSYANQAPVTFGFNAISGSADTEVFPFGCGTWGLSACYGDSRTGAAIGVASSGRVGVEASAQASGGTVDVFMPVKTQLTIGDKVNGVTQMYGAKIDLWNFGMPYQVYDSAPIDGVFHVSGSNAILSGASITANAPTFKASIDAVVNMDNEISAAGCFFLAGCSTSSATLNFATGKLNLAAVDSASDKPISVLGGAASPLTLGQEYVVRAGDNVCASQSSCDIQAAAPALAVIKVDGLQDVTGGTISGKKLSLNSTTPVLTMTADLTGIAQAILGVPVDVLNPNVNVGPGNASGSIVNARAGVQLGLTQSFTLDPRMQATLVFDKPVLEWVQSASYYENDTLMAEISGVNSTISTYFYNGAAYGSREGYAGYWNDPWMCSFVDCEYKDTSHWQLMGNSVTVNLAMGADLRFDGNADGNLLSRTYSIVDSLADFASNTSLSIAGNFPVKAGCFALSLSGIGSIGEQCAFNDTYQTANLANFNLYNNSFKLSGFNSQTFDLDAPSAVPEPSTIWLVLFSLFGCHAMYARRRAKTSK